jgi:hypothetical protein
MPVSVSVVSTYGNTAYSILRSIIGATVINDVSETLSEEPHLSRYTELGKAIRGLAQFSVIGAWLTSP